MTDEALDQYASRVLTDALRLEWDDTGQDDAFAPSKEYQNEMRALAANPEAWYKKKTEPPWRRYARRLSALAALAAVVFAAVRFLPDGGGAAAQASGGPLPAAIAALLGAAVAVALIFGRKHKK